MKKNIYITPESIVVSIDTEGLLSNSQIGIEQGEGDQQLSKQMDFIDDEEDW